jgi:hypothetical protein
LEAWYRWNLQQEFAALLFTASVGAPAISWSGTVPFACALQVEVLTGGSRSALVFRWSPTNGVLSDWTTVGPGLGATVALGNGVTLALPTGTYTAGHTYNMKRSSWRDNTSNSHHFTSIDGVSPVKNPTPRYTAYGTFLQFDGATNGLLNQTALATNMFGGTGKGAYVCAILMIDNTTPSASDKGTILCFGDSSSNHLEMWYYSDISGTHTHRSLKTNNANQNDIVSGGTPDTSIHVYELDVSGTTAEIRVDGSVVATGAQATGSNALTLNYVTIAKSFLGGAEGNPGAISYGEIAMYSTRPSSGRQSAIAADMRLRAGF